jgi:hypothetical protein
LPADGRARDEARHGSERMRDLVVRLRAGFEPRVERLQVRGISSGSQPFVLWSNRRLAEQRMRHPEGAVSRDLAEFCRVFPDTFFVSDRAPDFEAKGGKSGRLLTAGFHLMQGYFRDDAPLCELVLDGPGRRELDALWRELNFAPWPRSASTRTSSSSSGPSRPGSPGGPSSTSPAPRTRTRPPSRR